MGRVVVKSPSRMRTRVVVCQDARGRTEEFVVVGTAAATDERACAQALRTLNSWRAIRVLDGPTVEIEYVKPVALDGPGTTPEPVPPSPLAPSEQSRPVERGPRIVRHATVVALVSDNRTRATGNVGRALRAAQLQREREAS